ncbi:MAG: hypothetical protein IKT65_06100 [Clostridia bacterium]|nr:hypothetical protein [Clostridia bacterium]
MKNKKISTAALAVLLCVTMCSCSDLLGIDNSDYASESAVCTHEADGDISESLEKICTVLTFCPSQTVCFDTWQDASSEYIDIVLEYLAGTHFEKYSANGKMFDLLAEKYPELTINTLIPAEDLSNTVYEFFGGDIHIKHKDTSQFTYLDKINAYILTGRLSFDYTAVQMIHVEETENTYRATVRFSRNGTPFDNDYSVIFRKRDDDRAPYIHSVNVSNTVQW